MAVQPVSWSGRGAPVWEVDSRYLKSDSAQDFEQCAFACAVAADDADHIAFFDIEVDVFESPEGLLRMFSEWSTGLGEQAFG